MISACNFRNILFAPSALSSSGSSTFTGIHDAFLTYLKADPAEQDQLQQVFEKQISIATLAVQSATRILQDVTVT